MTKREEICGIIGHATNSLKCGEYTRETHNGLYELIKSYSPDRETWSNWNAFEARCALKGILEPTPLRNSSWYSGLTGNRNSWSFVKVGLQEQQLLVGLKLRSKVNCIWKFSLGGRIKEVEVYDPESNSADSIFSLSTIDSQEVPFTAQNFSSTLKEAITGNAVEEERNYYHMLCMLGHTFARDIAQNFWDHTFRMFENPKKRSPYRPLPDIIFNKYLAYAIRQAASQWAEVTEVRSQEGMVHYRPYVSKKLPTWM